MTQYQPHVKIHYISINSPQPTNTSTGVTCLPPTAVAGYPASGMCSPISKECNHLAMAQQSFLSIGFTQFFVTLPCFAPAQGL